MDPSQQQNLQMHPGMQQAVANLMPQLDPNGLAQIPGTLNGQLDPNVIPMMMADPSLMTDPSMMGLSMQDSSLLMNPLIMPNGNAPPVMPPQPNGGITAGEFTHHKPVTPNSSLTPSRGNRSV